MVNSLFSSISPYEYLEPLTGTVITGFPHIIPIVPQPTVITFGLSALPLASRPQEGNLFNSFSETAEIFSSIMFIGNILEDIEITNETIKQWFVMIKDANNRFTDNPLWGNGWGWALFKIDSLDKNSASDYKINCLGCHVPAKDKDLIYTESYPILTMY